MGATGVHAESAFERLLAAMPDMERALADIFDIDDEAARLHVASSRSRAVASGSERDGSPYIRTKALDRNGEPDPPSWSG